MAIFVIAEGNLFTKFPKGVFSFTMATKQQWDYHKKNGTTLFIPPLIKTNYQLAFTAGQSSIH
jgi:hypothetical protein